MEDHDAGGLDSSARDKNRSRFGALYRSTCEQGFE
jgi:hypothetical protein